MTWQDGTGIVGGILHYGLLFALVGSTLLTFLYLRKKGLLSFDEEAKHQMMQQDEGER